VLPALPIRFREVVRVTRGAARHPSSPVTETDQGLPGQRPFRSGMPLAIHWLNVFLFCLEGHIQECGATFCASPAPLGSGLQQGRHYAHQLSQPLARLKGRVEQRKEGARRRWANGGACAVEQFVLRRAACSAEDESVRIVPLSLVARSIRLPSGAEMRRRGISRVRTLPGLRLHFSRRACWRTAPERSIASGAVALSGPIGNFILMLQPSIDVGIMDLLPAPTASAAVRLKGMAIGPACAFHSGLGWLCGTRARPSGPSRDFRTPMPLPLKKWHLAIYCIFMRGIRLAPPTEITGFPSSNTSPFGGPPHPSERRPRRSPVQ